MPDRFYKAPVRCSPPLALVPQSALATAQQELAAALATSAEAQANNDVLKQQIRREEQQRELKRRATLEVANEVLRGAKDQTRLKGADSDAEVLVEKLRAQQAELAALRSALGSAQAKQAAAAQEAAGLMQQLSEADIKVLPGLRCLSA